MYHCCLCFAMFPCEFFPTFDDCFLLLQYWTGSNNNKRLSSTHLHPPGQWLFNWNIFALAYLALGSRFSWYCCFVSHCMTLLMLLVWNQHLKIAVSCDCFWLNIQHQILGADPAHSVHTQHNYTDITARAEQTRVLLNEGRYVLSMHGALVYCYNFTLVYILGISVLHSPGIILKW